MSDYSLEYYNYLLTRTKLGLFYRLKFYYPKISKRLKGNLLDYGCGIGDMLGYFKNSTGVDINKHCVAHCRSLNLKAVVLDNTSIIPFPDNSFDSVLMDNVLEHITEPRPLLKEIERVIKVNGNFVVGVPGILGYQKDPDHKKFYNKENLFQLISCEMGFELLEWFATPFNFPFAERMLSRYCIFGSFQKRIK